uniref:J domain-containing protein n=1 Tax=Plectus sambesii TaxID=2011161 RepID=A0A914WZM4_9BILA
MDDHERHYIGDLLADDDVFQTTQSNGSSAGQVPTSSVLAGAGSVGPSPDRSFWPEPPPPYSPSAPQWAALKQPGVYRGQADHYANVNDPNVFRHCPPNPMAFYNEVPLPMHMNSTKAPGSAPMLPSEQTKTAFRWDSVYTPFGPVHASPARGMGSPPMAAKTHAPVEHASSMPASRPLATKSYRDVASNRSAASSKTPPVLVAVSPSTGKKTTSSTNQRHSSSTESDSKVDNVRSLEDFAAKGSSVDGKNLSKKNVTTNTPGEFQKITRKKGKEKGPGQQSAPLVAPLPPPPQPLSQQMSQEKKAKARVDPPAPSPDNRPAVRRFELLAADSSPMPRATGDYYGERLNNEEEDHFHGSSHARKNATYINNDLASDDDSRLRKQPLIKKVKRDGSDQAQERRRRPKKRDGTVWDWIGFVLVTALGFLQRGGRWLLDLITDIVAQLSDITVYICRASCSKVTTGFLRAWHQTIEKLRNCVLSFRQRNWWSLPWRRGRINSSQFGLSENIPLPTTGDEAMQRLLKCRGQDAYSILGLRADCSDDDIKRYYKRQAVLVHPDKNQSYGADEAFKILARAFEFLGTPDQRQKYNLDHLRKDPIVQKEMEELWEQLRQKMNEAMNTMHCDCGKKHRRFLVDMRPLEARYCRKCKERHPARDNDIWAESRWWGCLWYYYACMDGAVYDITEWAGCPKNRLKHMKANSHTVQYRLISAKTASQMSSNLGRPQTRAPSSEAEIEDLLSCYLDAGRRRTA